MNVFQILSISQDLAGLTYFLGTLLMAIPVPVYGVKKWGPKLIVDGIYSSILVNLYETLILFVVQLGNYLGINWTYYISWLYQLLTGELQVYTLIRTLYATITSFPYGGINPIVGPLSLFLSLISGFMSITGTLIVISQLVYNYVGLILALGILMISIPFRIGRSIGGSFIGFSIVFYVGLPLLPSFLSAFNVNVLQSTVGSADNLTVLATQVIPAYIEGTVLMPLVYLGILASLSVGIGSVISGSYSRLPIPVDFL
ncbi:DNA import protein CedA [Metallosphaera sp. J1]|uniref:DNA import protein CedA n=1 Tax=Metallosphaera javensis (ex Hofmann et al. 2022) TaxID=99938 RepID=UPI001EDEF07A|nr:DNA import protein CedA [Metallosphaera javensis (ex Hofmann et al. 2022)]MCG3107748.1 DNA import protein CedA [Metallosphaera javensis (ex Hofmann et al. 2022)]